MTIAKTAKLGMSFGTARARLDRDIMYALAVQAGHTCHRCQQPLTRDTFSVEHKTSWMQAGDPVASFFDLENVAFSHARCNQLESAGRRRLYHTPEARREAERPKRAQHMRELYTPEARRAKYERTGH